MKLLFLDVDGVLNHDKTFMAATERTVYLLDPECVKRLQRIIRETDCKVVLSSTWRNHKEGLRIIDETVCKLYGKTGRLSGGHDVANCTRGREVKAWCEVNHLQLVPYAILDDDPDFFTWQPLFKTSFSRGGLTDEIANRVIKHLNGVTE